ncbi:MAG: nucleotide exchange factor GrpE [Bacteroidota bacterium]|jgi:molecular chaperone GrpE|nr:nucleotide exchange factor GrpE [Bacteroidota bacterium]
MNSQSVPENEAMQDKLTPEEQEQTTSTADAAAPEQDEVAALQAALEASKDQYVRLMAEFENFRKRTAKERLELFQTAGKDIIQSLLEVVDDMHRAEQQIEAAADVQALKEGVALVFSKLKSTLQHKGVKEMEAKGMEFNPDLHEAITEIPAPTEELKGKVVDVLERGYYMNDKLIRFAKVVVGK